MSLALPFSLFFSTLQPSWIYSILKIVAIVERRDGSGLGVLFRLVCKCWMLSVYVPDGLSSLSLQLWVLWRLTDRQTTVRGAVPEIDWKSEMLAGAVWSKQTAEQGAGVIEKGDRGIETNRGRGGRRARGSAVSQSWEQIGLKVTTPSMRWFSTEGNGAWVLSHKKQFIAKPTEVWEIQSLTECQIFSATNCAVSGP